MLRLLSKINKTTKEETNSYNNDSTNSNTEKPSESSNSIIQINDVNLKTDDNMKQVHSKVENVLENSLVEGLNSEKAICELSIEENSQPSLHNSGVNINLTMAEGVAVSEIDEITETEIIHRHLSEQISKAEDIYVSGEISEIKLPLKKRKHSVINSMNHMDNVEDKDQIEEYFKHKYNYLEENKFVYYPSKPAISIAELMDVWPPFHNYPIKKLKTAAERKEIPSTVLQ